MPTQGLSGRRRSLGVLVLVGSVMTTEAEAASPVRASVEVDASALGETGEVLGPIVQERAESTLREVDVAPGTSPSDPVLTMVLEPLSADAGFRTTYQAMRDGEPIEGTSGTNECRLCTDDELLEQIARTVQSVGPKLRLPTPQPTEPAVGESPPAVAAPVAPSIDRAPPMSGLGRAGLGLSVTGAAALGLGIGLAVSESLLLEEDSARARGLTEPGVAVAVVGAAMVGTGIAMLAVDIRRRRRAVAVGPGPGMAGLSLVGRF